MGSRGEAGGEPRCFLFLGLPREASVSLSQATDTSVQEEGEAGSLGGAWPDCLQRHNAPGHHTLRDPGKRFNLF